MGIQIKGSNDTISAADGSIVLEGATLTFTNENITGISTMASAEVSGNISIADKIIHTGDTNTAIRFPAADTVTVETGGSERLRITSAGDVGISTLAPASKLHLYDAASDGLILQSPSGLHYIWAIQAAGNLNNGSLAGELGIRGQSGVSISGNNGTATQLRINSHGAVVTGILTAAGNVLPEADGTRDLGSSTKEWKDLYIDGTANIDTLDVDATSNFAGDVTLVAAGSSTILFDHSAREIVFQDNLKAKFGTGSDLAIYHDSLNSYVTNSTGAIYIFNNETIIKNAANTATSIYANANDSVSLWFNNSKKVETTSGGFNVTGITTFSDRINVVSGVSTFADNAKLTFGTQADLTLSHNGTDSNILGSTGDLYIQNTGGAADDINIRAQDDINLQVDNGEAGIDIIGGGSVILYHHNNARVTTTDDGADVGGTASIKIPVGTTAQRNSSPADGDIRYNSTLNSYEGYGNSAWGGLGGGTEIDTSVSSTSATSITTFAHASYRSASIRVQIVQGSAYQVGRYLLIHDGTTVTIIEESAVATGSMLGTITAAIVSANVVVSVNMGSSSSATVTTIIDKITV